MKAKNIQTHTPIATAISALNDITGKLKNSPGVQILTPAGSLRRFEETVERIDIIGIAENPRRIVEAFTSLPQVNEVLDKGADQATVIVPDRLQVTLRMVEHGSYGAAMQHFTGNSEHNVKLIEHAQSAGLSLSEEGITEEDLYRRLGLQYIPPEIREGQDEIEKAKQGAIPRLLEPADIKGDLHVHTTWSDGRNSLKEMVLAAKSLGYSYIGIADHSSGSRIAGGKGYREQSAEIDKLNREIDGIHILRGAEVNIEPDGTLETKDEYLSELDYVVAAVHRELDLPRDQMTNRLIKAIEHPYVDILAHPTSRRVLPVAEWIETGPVDADMEAVFQAAARTNTILEIDSMPSRLDLKDTDAYRARDLGIMLSIDTDSHSIHQLENIHYGVGVARRAWCSAPDIANTRPLNELKALLGR